MKANIVALAICMMSGYLYGFERSEFTALITAENEEFLSFIRRAHELESRLDTLSQKTADLQKRVTTTHNRIECAGKIVQGVVVCGVVALIALMFEHFSKKNKHFKETKEFLKHQEEEKEIG